MGDVVFRPAIAASLLCATALSCTAPEDEPAAPGETESVLLASLPRLRAVEEIRTGSVDDPDVGFSSITGVAVDDDGLVYVFEGQAMEFRVYDPDGTFVRRFARRGEGPGEFEWPPALRPGAVPRLGARLDRREGRPRFPDLPAASGRRPGGAGHPRRRVLSTRPTGGRLRPRGLSYDDPPPPGPPPRPLLRPLPPRSIISMSLRFWRKLRPASIHLGAGTSRR